MKQFNLNNKVLVQITEYGWNELLERYGQTYIDACVIPHKKIVNDIEYYEMQAHEIISNWGHSTWWTNPCPISVNILIPN